MPQLNIACFEVSPWEKQTLQKQLKGHKLFFSKDILSDKNKLGLKHIQVLSVFIYSQLSAKVLKQLPTLKLICTRSTGFDHIDLKYCRKHKIAVCNVPSYGENTVAEHTFALILALSRNVHKSYLRSLARDYSIEGLIGFDLQGKTLGVLGAGSIGLHVIRIAKGFGMQVLAYDPYPNKAMAEILGYQYAPLNDVLKKADILSLHMPHTPETHHMINRASLKRLKKGVILINTARGALVETEALLQGLDQKIIAGVGLDVLEGEALIKEEKQILYDKSKLAQLGDLIKDHLLLSRDNVVFTPHIAFYSHEALQRILETTVHNIEAFTAGKPINLVGKH